MSNQHFISCLPLNIDTVSGQPSLLQLEDRIVKHMQVARIAKSEQFVLSDGQGNGWLLEFVAFDKKSKQQITVNYIETLFASQVPKVTLVQGVAAADRMDLVVRQATELGINRVIPLDASRSTAKISKKNSLGKLERWQRISLAAAEQSGQLWLPEILPVQDLESALVILQGCSPKICPWEEASSGSLREVVAGTEYSIDSGAALIIGPEGGFTADEVQRIKSAGFEIITLGKTILRTETAATVAAALLMHQLGGLQ